MLRTVYLILYLLWNLLFLMPILQKAKKLELQGRFHELYGKIFDTAYRIGRGLVKRTGSTVEVTGLENIPEGPVLFVSNHQSYFDIPLLMGFIDKPKSYIAKIELAKLPIISSWMKIGKCVFIDRDDPRQSLKAINEGINILKSGHSMVIFPEGTRSKGSEMLEFKKGSLRLATKSKVPIVPVTINGSYKILEANNGRIKPANIHIVISKPILTDNLSREDESQLSDKVYQIIQSHLSE